MSESVQKKTDKKQKLRNKLRAPKWLKAIWRPIKKVLSIIFWPFRPLGRYVAGAWVELRQVKWPTRALTLKLTGAVIAFTIVLTIFIVSLDFVFEQIVKRILL